MEMLSDVSDGEVVAAKKENENDGSNEAANKATIKEEDEEEERSVGYEESAERDEIIRERINRTQEQMKDILDQLSDEQLKRYETFRRIGFPRPILKKFMHRVLDQPVNPSSVIVVAGIAKVFVGEVIEGARQVMEEEARCQLIRGDPSLSGDVLEERLAQLLLGRPLEPFHIIESHRRMREESFTTPHSRFYRKKSAFL